MNNAKQDRARCTKINAIREAARTRLGVEPSGRCPTCGRAHGDAYARKDARGHVVEGCVDAFHAGAGFSDPECAAWWARPAAQAIRAAELAHLVSL